MDLSLLFTGENIVALLTLSALEIVLGIDNIVFIAILSAKLPPEHRNRARRLGLLGAMIMRVVLLLGISWVMGLTTPLFTLPWMGDSGVMSGKDLILLIGGLFLIGKAVHEIHNKLEGDDLASKDGKPYAKMSTVITQIMVMDMIFSLDSVITAVGMVQPTPQRPLAIALAIMITAVVIAIIVMMVFARPISDFVERHPTVKMLALSFLVLIGVMLVADAFDHHIPKGYIYFAMAFSMLVELLNMRLRRAKTPPVKLRDSHLPDVK